MSSDSAAAVPTQALLRAALRQTFTLETAQAPVPVLLHAVEPGIAMNERFTAYSAWFVLPEGMDALQGSYRVRHPDGEQAWDLFMTPTRPGADRRGRLQAVFHYEPPSSLNPTGDQR